MILEKVYNNYINKSINNYKSAKKFKSLFTVGFKSALKSIKNEMMRGKREGVTSDVEYGAKESR